MAALTADRPTKRAEPVVRALPVAAGVVIFAGAMVAVDTSGFARPARTSTTDRVLGVNAYDAVNNTSGAAGALTVYVSGDVAFFANNAASVTAAMVGADCYAVDDQTVDATNGGGTRVRAGEIWSLDAANGVGVLFGN